MTSRSNPMPMPDPGRLSAPGTGLAVPRGREIFAQGGESDAFFKVVSGVVRICRFLGDGRRQIDSFHAEGDIFGLALDGARDFTAEAVNDCVLVAYRRSTVLAQAQKDGALAHQLFHLAMQALDRARTHGLLLGRRAAAEKMAGFLLDQAAASADGRTVILAMTRQDIGDYLGLTIETVSRSLHQFERQHLIALSGNRDLRITGRAALEIIAAT